MRVSAKILTAQAAVTGFRPNVLEKVAHLLGLLEALQNHPFLKGKLALKGGTALNLFIFNVPRLSVDIDLNYVGAETRETMLAERSHIERAFQAVFAREGFTVRRMPEDHAGGKWALRYGSGPGRTGNLEVDLNFMFRTPLWPITLRNSQRVGAWRATGIPVLDQHELAAGKLVALLSRKQARDLFDSQLIFRMENFERDRLRIGFVVYGAMNRIDWRIISVDAVDFDPAELSRQLMPVLRVRALEVESKTMEYGARLVEDCRKGLSAVLPLADNERAFLDLLLEKGVVDATLLTSDPVLQERIQKQPLLAWKAFHVRRHNGLG